MNSYEINILFKAEEDADLILKRYESQLESGGGSLESVLPKLFKTNQVHQSENFNIDAFKKNTNEILIECYGTKFPSIKLHNLFTELQIDSEHGIKLKSFFDGDGKAEFYCIVNGSKCSRQKYSAFSRKFKIKDPSAKKKKVKKPTTSPKKRIPKDKSPSEKQLNLVKSFDYGKSGKANTAIIRLLIRKKANRKIVRELFEKYINIRSNNEFIEFSNSFDNLVSSETSTIRWCKYTKHESDESFKGPEKIINDLAFVVEQDNYIYLGFNIENLGLKKGRSIDNAFEHLTIIIDALDGVNKTWIKCRLGNKWINHLLGEGFASEYFIYFPEGGSPQLLDRDLTEDYLWPQI